jgi:hypothetical protein
LNGCDQRWSPEWVVQEFDSTYKDLIFRRILDTLGTACGRCPERFSTLVVMRDDFSISRVRTVGAPKAPR